MLRSHCRRYVAGLAALGALAGAALAPAPAAAETTPLFPAGVMVVPVVGVVSVGVSPVVVTTPAIGIGTQRTHIEKDRSHSRERADVTIAGQ